MFILHVGMAHDLVLYNLIFFMNRGAGSFSHPTFFLIVFSCVLFSHIFISYICAFREYDTAIFPFPIPHLCRFYNCLLIQSVLTGFPTYFTNSFELKKLDLCLICELVLQTGCSLLHSSCLPPVHRSILTHFVIVETVFQHCVCCNIAYTCRDLVSNLHRHSLENICKNQPADTHDYLLEDSVSVCYLFPMYINSHDLSSGCSSTIQTRARSEKPEASGAHQSCNGHVLELVIRSENLLW